MNTNFKLEILGFTSQEQIDAFVSWYSNSGEQSLAEYFSGQSHGIAYLSCVDKLTTPLSMTIKPTLLDNDIQA